MSDGSVTRTAFAPVALTLLTIVSYGPANVAITRLVAERDVPGRRLSLDVGYRYEATDRIGLMLQLNTLYRSRDAGREAEPDDTGGRFVYLSPGVSYAVSKNAQVYAFVQKPLYQHVNGVQLTADWSALAGFSVRF